MRKIEAWDEVVNRFSKRLSMWKAKLLSGGGRLTLVKAVLGSLPLYFFSIFRAPEAVISRLETIRRRFLWGMNEGEKKMSWVNWNKVMLDKEDGGLGIGSLKAKNLGLLAKWKWRFFNDSSALWCKVISEIHGSKGGFDVRDISSAKSGVWVSLVRCCFNLSRFDIDLDEIMVRKICSGTNTLFWQDNWIKGCGPLKDRFPRLFALEQHGSCSVAERWAFSNGAWSANWAWRRQPTGRAIGDISSILNLIDGLVLDSSKEDGWVWNIQSSGNFFVSSLCSLIQKKMLVSYVDSPKFGWNSWVPRKVNVCAWRVALDRLPTRENLLRRGLLHLDSSSCLFCDSEVESKDHCFLSCPKIKHIWLKIWSWWNVPPLFNPSLDDILHGIPSLFSNKWKAKLFHAVCLGVIWSIWAWRNRILHAPSDEEKLCVLQEDIFLVIQRMLLLWTSNRAPNNHFSWANWILYPNELLDP